MTDAHDCIHCHDVLPDYSSNERRTWAVVALTFITMIAELVVGYWSGSMALTADGWHMGTHVGALALAALAYWWVRRQRGNRRYSFGAGKALALAGYTNAMLLGVVAVIMVVESVERLLTPVPIKYDVALIVAGVGLLVNLASAALLGHGHDHGHDQAHEHDHDHSDHDHVHEHHDHNLKAAYLHVLADALTSVLAIVALLVGRFAGFPLLDPIMGIVGALVILYWGLGLVRATAGQLLDKTPNPALVETIRAQLEAMDDSRVRDLHVWEFAPGRYGCIVSLTCSHPRELAEYRAAILKDARIHHLTVEVATA
ncbi:MAG: CDF family Co(II)/Ni(II) efflux transporter DmeF [Planctomycetes bacterium]|nr:CDF family Co(II)/Ni(II) efflux transporter DmeF [Planctomycetota bacterium]MCB9935671.1 CDF family Co(II)/Ni(II) efflux transporter DmeF [Planctomycetota bacterium]